MRTKKAGPGIIMGAFLIIICFSGVLWLTVGKYFEKESIENRELAPLPSCTLDTLPSFPREFEAFYNDHLQFRNELIEMNTYIDYHLFERAMNDSVVIGKNGWLFYSKEDDGDPIACYEGTNLLSEEELQQIADNCVKQRDFLADLGKEFVIYIVPNKERMYYKKMPDYYGKPVGDYRALQIVNYLKENTDLRVVYPYDELKEAQDSVDYNIWYKTDTHWNWLGGYVGACALLHELGIEMPALDSDEIKISLGESITGDLAKMLGFRDASFTEDIDYTLSGYDEHNVKNPVWDFPTLIWYYATNADPRKLMIYRDSFASNMSPYIGSQFSETKMYHREVYTYEDFLEFDPDIFVYEITERHVGWISFFSVR